MKKTLIFLTILLFTASAFADIKLSSTPIRETEKTNHSFFTRDILYEQLANISAEGGISSQDFEASFDLYDAEGADEFVVPVSETWTINEVVILGSYSATGPCDLGNVRFYADDAGMPGTLLYEYLDVPASPTATGDLDCLIPDTVLPEGTYWLGFQGRIDFGTSGQWFWTKQAAPTIGYEFYWRNPGDGFGTGCITWTIGSIAYAGYVDYNLSFGLYGTSGGGPSYPISYGNTNTYEWITNVTLTDINNTTGQETGGYGDYTALIADVTVGQTYDLSSTIEYDSNDYLTAWIDWNHDYDFSDAGEEYILASGVSANGPFIVPVTVPAGYIGETRMRVSLKWGSAPLPDEVFSYGEVEDYTVNIIDAPTTYTLPFAEGFEGGALPTDWTQEYVVGTVDWTYQNGGQYGNPAAAHTGAYNACFYTGSYNGETTQLITPQIDMGTATNVDLTFWHTQTDWVGDQDELRVYYKNSAAGTWTLLAEYLSSIPSWTEEIISLPDLSDDYYIAFEGLGDYGYGVCVDDITIEEGATIYTLPITEGFEGGVIPDGWSNEYVVGTVDWAYQNGGQYGNPAAAHTGAYNACFYTGNYNGETTKLVSPQIDMGIETDVELTFWHTQTDWVGDQDELRVYYKDSAAGTWTLLAEYLTSTPAWTEEVIALPDLSNDYYIAFEGFGDYGYGVCLDDISIEEVLPVLPFAEGFEGTFPPADWTLDTAGAGWIQSASGNGHTGDFAAMHSDDMGAQDDWLITPAVDLTAATAPGLTFWQYDYYASYYVEHNVCVSTDMATWDVVYTGVAATTYEEIAIDLTAYAGQTIYVGFQYLGDYADRWYVDDVAIAEVVPPLPFVEGFEGTFPPADWTLVTAGAGWIQSASGTGHTGDFAAMHSDDMGAQDDWLITPAVDLTAATAPELTFWQYDYYASYYVEHNVCVSTDMATWDVVYTGVAATTYEEIAVDLTAYAGQSIYVGFQYLGDYADRWYVDDVTIDEAAAPEPPDVFFSQYIEGSSYNKALEIYNGTGATINLDDFQLWQITNGGTWYEYTIDFPVGATLDAGDVWVVCHTDADPAMLAVADQILTLYHNGDDAQGLAWDNGTDTFVLIDEIGEEGDDPGDGWDVAGVTDATKDHTLIRKADVTTGNTDWTASAGTNAEDSEWLVFPQNTFTNLGQHPYIPPVLDPPQNLFVDDTGYATWDEPAGGGGTIYTDDFEAYTVGGYLAVQSADWTTWSNLPGTAEDALISDVQALSGSNSVVVEGTSDLVLIMDNYTSGVYSMELNLFVPTGYCGYWNLQKTNTIGQEWAFQIQFDVTGIATADAGAAAALTFPFNFDTWINMELVIDLDADWCEIWVDGVMLYEYQWTLGTFGTPGLLSLGGMNLYAWASAGNNPMCYFDDITFSEITSDEIVAKTKVDMKSKATENRDFLGYNVYIDGAFVAFTTDLFYQYLGLVDGQTYMAGVTALYDEGESTMIEFEFTYIESVLNPPQNLFVDNLGYATWEAPGGGGDILIDQPPNQSNGIFADASYPQVLADNFILTAETTIAQLVVWGGYYASNTPIDPDYFTVIFHDDDAGLPGATLTTEVDVPYVREQTGIQLFGVDEWMHTLTLASPVTLAAGTYWVEFYNTTGYPATDTYFWEVGNLDPVNGIMGQAWSTTVPGSAWSFDGAADMAMQLISGADGDLVASTKKSKVNSGIQEKTRFNSSSRPMMISEFSLAPNLTPRIKTNTASTRDFLGYNVYLDGAFPPVFTTDLFYQYLDLVIGTTYLAEVTALYDEGESAPVDYTFTYLPTTLDPPENLAVTDQGYATWDPPAGGGPQTIQVDPLAVPYWTGSCTDVQYTDDSEVRGWDAQDGWMMFDISAIPAGATITGIEFNGYINANNWPYWDINGVYLDPLTATVWDLYADIQDDTYNQFMDSGTNPIDWRVEILGGTANADMEAALAQGWFCIGINSTDNSTTYYINFDGWNEANPPFLMVDYETDDGIVARTKADMKSKVAHQERIESDNTRDLLGYNVYLDTGTGLSYEDFTTDLFYDYDDGSLIPGQTYPIGVSALYDEGESIIIEESFTYAGGAVGGYFLNTVLDGGNPGGLNTDTDSSTTGWTAITAGGEAVNVWSAVQTFPVDFSFLFYNQPVTEFKVSLNGLLTFDVTAPEPPPDTNVNLPAATLPDKTIAMFWDEFTLAPPVATSDKAYMKIFGTAPYRQLWIKYYSFEVSAYSYAYWGLALEETTNRIYIVDMNYSNPVGAGSSTIGLQYDATTAIEQADSPNFAFLAGGSSNADNDYYEFIPLIPGAPGYPENPVPADGASDIACAGDLMWDFGIDTDTYDLWFGPAGAMVEVVSGATAGTSGTYPYSGLPFGTTYEWQVICHNATADLTTNGSIWNFTTMNNPVFVQVGDGVVVNQSLPVEPFYGYSYSNVIYLASEIFASGDITGVQYQYQTTGGFGDPDDIVIYMGHTTQSEFIDGTNWIDVTTMTEVFNGQLHFPPAAGDWFQIVFPVPFTYNGTDNLVIAWDENTAGYHSSSDEFFCTATTPIRGICYYNDSTNPDPLAPPTANAVRNSIANVRLNDLVQPFGTLDGYVYESGTTNGILNAEVTCAGVSAITDATGYYMIPVVAIGTHDATADHADYFPETVSVVITEGVLTSQNFGLEWAEIIVDPLFFDISILPDATDDEIITLTNNGPHELTYNVGLNFISDRTSRRVYEPVIKQRTKAVNLSYNEVDVVTSERNIPAISTDDLFDLQFQYPCAVATGEAGVETDGNYIYTTEWNGAGGFFRYNMDGTYVGQFFVAGAQFLRDLAWDGTYFYGAAATTSLYQMDFTPGAEVLISTITAPVACRAIAYDDAANGFWANNWSTDITLFDMTGVVITSFPCGTAISFYGFAYDDFSAGGPFLWGFSQNPANTLVQFDIATGLETGVFFDVGTLVGSPTGSAGGMFISDLCVPGTATIGCLIQNEWIVGMELCVTETWLSITNNGSGVIPGYGGTIDVTAHFDATGLILGEVKTGEIIVNHNAVTGGPEVLPVTMTVEVAFVAPDVFFSEYIEGSSNNKALEIYNNTGAVINLDDYRIAQSVNGGGWAYWHIFPVGATVVDGDVWVMLNADTDPLLFDFANADEILAYPSVVHHNGDDARGLEWTPDGGTTWVMADVIGIPTEDPGTGWPVAGVTNATQNHTLVRKEEITTGNTDWLASAGTDPTDSEWIVYPEDTFIYLGIHPGVFPTIYTLPFTEGFEGGVMPDDWSQEYVVGTTNWAYQNGGYSGHPAAAHTGSFNAFFYNTSGATTKLVTPQIDMGTATNVELTFWHTQAVWAGDQDNLRVYYKNSAAGTWTLLAEYLGDIPAWTEEIITLPDLSGDYYIAFEGFGDYGYGVCLDDISIDGGTPPFPAPTNVSVDPSTWLCTWDAPEGAVVFDDNFDSYIAGEFLCTQTTDWSNWSNTPGGADDAYVVDVQSNSPSNSLEITGASDIIHPFGDLTVGNWAVSFMMYIEPTYGGYFNLLHEFTEWRRVRTEWALEAYFGSTGSGTLHAGGTGAATFTHPVGGWFEIETLIDLDADWAEFYVDGVFVHEWQWSLQSTGTPGLCQLGAIDLFAAAPAGQTPLFYIDDFAHTTIGTTTRDLIGYNVYKDGALQTTTPLPIDVFDYQYTDLIVGQEYTAGVSAVYDDPGESVIVTYVFIAGGIQILPPENLTAEIVTFNDVLLNWEAPGGAGEILIDQVPNQVNGLFDDAAYPQVVADNFVLAAEQTIAQLVVWGGYFSTNTPVVDYFTVIFHNDTAGLPGATISTEVDVPSTRVQTGIVLFGVDEWLYTLTLATPVTLTAGTYWVEFYNTTGYPATDVFFWETGNLDPVNGIVGSAWATTAPGSGWNLDGATDLSLQLISGTDGDNVASNRSSRVQEITPVNNKRANSSSMRPMMISETSVKAEFTHTRRTNTAVTDDLRILLGYKVYEGGTEIVYIEDPGILTYTHQGVSPGVHDYYVTAMYDEGESDPSNPASVDIVLPIPQNVQAVFNYPIVMVTWNPISDSRDFVIYNVYRDGVQVGTATNTMYPDPGLASGDYCYNITAEFDGGYESEWSNDAWVTVTESDNILIPVRTELTGNYPNPFNPETTIKFSLKEAGNVNIKVYNIKGAVVRTIIDGELNAAYHEIIWDGKDNTGKQVGSGVYFYKMKAEKYTATKKMILMK